MGQHQIIKKLYAKFQNVPQNEEDIVYILSRIRKVLEINKYPTEFKILKFYCDLSLHSEIDRVSQEVAGHVKEIYENKNSSMLFLEDFHDQLKKFMNSYDLPNFYKHIDFRGGNFIKLLYAVNSETPITVKVDSHKYQLVFGEDMTLSGSLLE